jgi:F420-dependent oxidoreductase-like protein
MKIGLQVPDFTWPGAPASIGPVFRAVAERAEHAEMSSLWVMDHFFQIAVNGPPEHEMLEGWSALAYAAAVTERISLGTLVTGVTYRHPGVLVKTATTLDVLSGGRAWLGIGAAWNEEEHLGLGVPYPPVAERFERLEETLRIAHQMWTGDEKPFEGKHYQLARPLNSPPAISTPHPRVMIGGTGERKTLRLVAQYADACNLFELPLPAIRHKLDVLQGHCADVARDYADIERTTVGRLAVSSSGADGAQTVDQAVERFGQLAELGIDHAIVILRDVHDDATWDLVPDVVAQVAGIVPAGRGSASSLP